MEALVEAVLIFSVLDGLVLNSGTGLIGVSPCLVIYSFDYMIIWNLNFMI